MLRLLKTIPRHCRGILLLSATAYRVLPFRVSGTIEEKSFGNPGHTYRHVVERGRIVVVEREHLDAAVNGAA